MSMSIEHRAEDPKRGFTLGELHQAVQTALEAGADPRSPVKAVVGWKTQLQAVKA